MECIRFSPPKTLPKRRNESETGRNMIETTSIMPTGEEDDVEEEVEDEGHLAALGLVAEQVR